MSKALKDMMEHSNYDTVDELITDCYRHYEAGEPGWLLAHCMNEVLEDYLATMNRGVAHKDAGLMKSGIDALKELDNYEVS